MSVRFNNIYILLTAVLYDIPWVIGVFTDLDELLEYIRTIYNENNEYYIQEYNLNNSNIINRYVYFQTPNRLALE